MKKLLTVLIVAAFSMSAYAADKKPAPQKKEVKKHKKVEGTKVPDAAPKAPAKKDDKKKK
jgi:Ni/Co efflux regulator RcnB